MPVQLEKDIIAKRARIAVIGLGYVGMPLALSFARKGFTVYGVDTDHDRVNRLLSGTSYITGISDGEVSRVIKSGRFVPTTDVARLRECRVMIICVPTPIKKRYTPDISFMMSAVRAVAKNISKGALVVLESTTYPGTTDEMVRPQLEKGGRQVGRDFFLAFSPERIDPGNQQYTVTKIPKVVGGVTPACGRLTELLYSQIIKQVHVVSSPAAAEMTKLMENTFRIVNIGWVNEAAMMCHRFGIDIWEVIEAAKTKPFGFMPFYPGLGVGGHCIPEDPIYLYWKARQKGHASRFIKLAADLNSSMPEYAVHRIAEILNGSAKRLSGARILILGVTYKKDVKDLRKSPPLRLMDELQKKNVKVDFYDPLIPWLNINGIRAEGVELTAGVIARYDCVVVAVDHTKVDYAMVLKNARAIFDVKNVYSGTISKKVVKL